jgi:hypothetical protein
MNRRNLATGSLLVFFLGIGLCVGWGLNELTRGREADAMRTTLEAAAIAYSIAADDYGTDDAVVQRVAFLNRSIGLIPTWYGPRMEYAEILGKHARPAEALAEVEACIEDIEQHAAYGPFGESVALADLPLLKKMKVGFEQALKTEPLN